jgi:hypothetical protein
MAIGLLRLGVGESGSSEIVAVVVSMKGRVNNTNVSGRTMYWGMTQWMQGCVKWRLEQRRRRLQATPRAGAVERSLTPPQRPRRPAVAPWYRWGLEGLGAARR